MVAFIGLTFWELILIFVIALLIFGPKKLPDLGKAIGSSLREFKKATQGNSEEPHEDKPAK